MILNDVDFKLITRLKKEDLVRILDDLTMSKFKKFVSVVIKNKLQDNIGVSSIAEIYMYNRGFSGRWINDYLDDRFGELAYSDAYNDIGLETPDEETIEKQYNLFVELHAKDISEIPWLITRLLKNKNIRKIKGKRSEKFYEKNIERLIEKYLNYVNEIPEHNKKGDIIEGFIDGLIYNQLSIPESIIDYTLEMDKKIDGDDKGYVLLKFLNNKYDYYNKLEDEGKTECQIIRKAINYITGNKNITEESFKTFFKINKYV